MELNRQLGPITASLVVVASMIGTGIFVTTGDILNTTYDSLTILILWAVGGIVALAGSLCYAELATLWPDVGGEYVYLKKIYGLLPSFLTGWISLMVGFSASVAASSITLLQYVNSFLSDNNLGAINPNYQPYIASGIILIFGIIHILGVKEGSRIQNVLTLLKLFIVISLVAFGLSLVDWNYSERLTAVNLGGKVSDTSFFTLGLVLLQIMFAYTGWNGAAYIAGEIKNPVKNLPKALFIGTLLTAIIYIGMNIVFIMASPANDILGQKAIGAITTKNLFGLDISNYYNLGIALILLSSVSVQVMIGPRVYYAMAKDKVLFQKMSELHPRFKTPVFSIILQITISIFYILLLYPNVHILIIYMGFALSIFPLLSILGLLYTRYKYPKLARPFKVPFLPLIAGIYICLTLWMMLSSMYSWTSTSLFALGITALGIPVYFLWKISIKKR